MIRDFFRSLTAPAWAAVAAIVAAILGLLIFAVLSWGQSRYDDGVTDTDARWEAAGRRLERQAERAGTAADRREAARIDDHTAALAAEKKEIDDAIAEGVSPLDVLFPAAR